MVPDRILKRRPQPGQFASRPAVFLASTTFRKTKVTLEKATELALGGSVLHLSCRTPHKSTFCCNFPGFDVAI